MKCVIILDVDTGEVLHEHKIEKQLFEMTDKELKTLTYKKCAWIRMRYKNTNRRIIAKVYETF